MTAPAATPLRDVTALGGDNRPLLIAIANSWRDFLSGNPEAATDPSPGGAELTAIAPTTAVHAAAAFTLTATGTGFVKGFHEIRIASGTGSVGGTTFVSATSLTAQVTPGAVAGSATVRVSGAEGSKTLTYT